MSCSETHLRKALALSRLLFRHCESAKTPSERSRDEEYEKLCRRAIASLDKYLTNLPTLRAQLEGTSRRLNLGGQIPVNGEFDRVSSLGMVFVYVETVDQVFLPPSRCCVIRRVSLLGARLVVLREKWSGTLTGENAKLSPRWTAIMRQTARAVGQQAQIGCRGTSNDIRLCFVWLEGLGWRASITLAAIFPPSPVSFVAVVSSRCLIRV